LAQAGIELPDEIVQQRQSVKTSRIRSGAAFVVFGILFFLANLVQSQPLKVPYVSVSPNPAPVWIAHEAGLFKKNNLDVELIYIPGGTVIIQTMLSGEVKVANMAPPAAIGAWAKGADLALIGTGVNRLLETVMTSAEIKRPEDLKGKKIGISRYGSLTDIILREGLRQYKLSPEKDVVILQVGGEGPRLAALKSGGIDGAMLSGDQRFQAEKMGFHVLIDFSRLPIDYPINGMVARKDFIRGQRELLKRFVKSWAEGIKIVKTDKDFSLRVLKKYLRTDDREILDKSYEQYKPVFETVPYPERKGIAFALNRLAETSPEAGKLKPEDFTDATIIAELEKEGFFKSLYSEKADR
jgi:NitT/TauT family transport system substrate-binding protein